MADKVFTMTLNSGSPSKNGNVVAITDGGNGGTSVVVTIGENLTPQDVEERLRAFFRAYRRAMSKTRTIAGITVDTTNE